MDRAEVVIIGAGIIGCSIAYHLAKNGCHDVIVIDKGGIASGITGICPGGIRQQWGTEINCRMSKASAEFYYRMNEELELTQKVSFRKVGYLLTFHTEEASQRYKEHIRLQNRLGIPTKMIGAQEVKEIIPGINEDSFLSASFCADDGFADDAYEVTNSFANKARSLGVRFINDEVLDVTANGDQITGVKTRKREIACANIVNAAGNDSPEIARFVGVHLPINREKRRILFTNRIEERVLEPLLISFEKGFAAKQLTDGTIYLSYLRDDLKKPYDSFEFQLKAAEAGMEIFPPLEKVEFRRHLDGIYDSTPDHQAILGGVDGLQGYYQAVGMSGHGFMMAPAIGRTVAEVVMGQEPFIDIELLHLNRFSQDQLIPEPSVV